jgi:uncharacterized Ntn-hydrolase superfamily protein
MKPVKLSTFSIVGRDPDGNLGVAVSSRVIAVGASCPFVRAGTVAIACQAYLNPYLALDLLGRLEQGTALGEAFGTALGSDGLRGWRQMIAIGPSGPPFGFTGEETDPWHGHRLGSDCAAAGNLLVGPETIDAMIAAFEDKPDLDLPERLVSALASGQAAGGDRRGRQSAALLVGAITERPWVDLRVDEHPDPVAELVRIFEMLSPDDLARARRAASTREPRSEPELRARRDQVRAALAEQGR